MVPAKGKIYIIDDDPSVRRGIEILLKSAGYLVEPFASADDFMDDEYQITEGCILLDIFMEGRSGLDLQEDISNKFPGLPIIFITGQGDVPMSVSAMKKGAVNFLQKPLDDKVLLKEVEAAIALSRQWVVQFLEKKDLKQLVDSLTPRELQIFKMLLTGMLNKQIAAELNIAEHTVKLHRGKITEKLGVKSVAEMVHLAEKMDLW